MRYGRKYGNRIIKNAKGKFDSRLEWHRFCFLQEAQDKGIITNLRKQVPFELIPKQPYKDTFGKKHTERSCVYIADFVYMFEGREVIEDVKSEATRKKDSYIIKRKLMRQRGNPIREVLHSAEDIL